MGKRESRGRIVSILEEFCFEYLLKYATILTDTVGIGAGMDPLLEIPKDRKPLKVVRICLLTGLTLLLYMMLSSYFDSAAALRAAVNP